MENPFEIIYEELKAIRIELATIKQGLSKPAPQIVDDKFLAQEIGITRQTLGRWRAQGRIPFIQIGSVIRYDFLKVIEALEKEKK